MNELLDKLILRIIFTLFMCLMLLVYKYAHTIFYPTSRQQLFKRFYPSKNPADTLHLFSRILGIGIIFSEFYFHLSDGFFFAMFDFFLKAILACVFYLLSVYIIEGIVLFDFEYNDEIIKKKNMSYSLVCFTHALAMAYLMKSILSISQDSQLFMFFLWLFVMVMMGFATKSFKILSKINLNASLVQKNTAGAFSYLGFFWGCTIIIVSGISNEVFNLKEYIILVVLKILLSIIIIPIFIYGLKWIFKLQDDIDKVNAEEKYYDTTRIEYSYGIYEGLTFFTCCFLTTVTTGQINFGTFYPVF
ncbi:MAG: hypothetical protein COW00_17165 [Bdellovibrio sp. CG12_big_fil_rev_8_21_14_0_65_39_13]|nr:MAG: hypothetical protein COW78_00335 [Bdellovibrio sp. CG22_combo_CG10-13_8_21_14_all_39_27]PIQ58165.1 MAG: hypothetical protein COW00_17165 [Bdellovibrio sp. CG12_big_fil_rev_8_21_14_0_65_39_13]PIR34327.1 MAG: hypothetical protein COV37_13405 [Bdellovibrio sp. CG11_big_fil_rev_8_21_14_0_20_39_38]PJB52226.1 MAG: hypothetical protein CO099_13710 [Bdellovibrio sp. CG_4_9_14_3_um_filter_39_7]